MGDLPLKFTTTYLNTIILSDIFANHIFAALFRDFGIGV